MKNGVKGEKMKRIASLIGIALIVAVFGFAARSAVGVTPVHAESPHCVDTGYYPVAHHSYSLSIFDRNHNQQTNIIWDLFVYEDAGVTAQWCGDFYFTSSVRVLDGTPAYIKSSVGIDEPSYFDMINGCRPTQNGWAHHGWTDNYSQSTNKQIVSGAYRYSWEPFGHCAPGLPDNANINGSPYNLHSSIYSLIASDGQPYFSSCTAQIPCTVDLFASNSDGYF